MDKTGTDSGVVKLRWKICSPFPGWSCILGQMFVEEEGGRGDAKWKPCFPLMSLFTQCRKTRTYLSSTIYLHFKIINHMRNFIICFAYFTLIFWDYVPLDIVIHNTFHWKRFAIEGKPWHFSNITVVTGSQTDEDLFTSTVHWRYVFQIWINLFSIDIITGSFKCFSIVNFYIILSSKRQTRFNLPF